MTTDTQIRDSAGVKINPAIKENQYDLSTFWQTYLTDTATIKAEESGKVIVCTDIIVTGWSSTILNYGDIRQGGAAGTIISYILSNRDMYVWGGLAGFRGAAYDGSGGGNLYWTKLGGDIRILFSGFMVAV